MRRMSVGGLALALLLGACTATQVEPATPSTLTTTSSTAPPMTTSTTPPDTTTTTTRAPSGPGHGGTAIIGYDWLGPESTDSALNMVLNDNSTARDIANLWVPRVWTIAAGSNELVPSLVTELPTLANGGLVINDDGSLTITYRIDPDAVWSDGTPITAADLDFTLDVNLNEELESEFRSTYTDAAIRETIAEGKTYTMILREPTLAYESFFEWVYPAHALADAGPPEEWTLDSWPSGGPFVLTPVEDWDRILLERNDAFWKVDSTTGSSLPYLDSVEFLFIPEYEALQAAFLEREVDLVEPPPWMDGLKPLLEADKHGVVVSIMDGPVWEHVNFQFGRGRLESNESSCNENLTYRRAIAHAIDRESLAREYYDGYVGALSSYVDVFTPSMSGSAWDRYPYDPVLAATLFEQAVEEVGRECAAVFVTTGNADMRPWVSDQLEGLFEVAGIPYSRDLQDSTLFFGETLEDGTWDLGQWAWSGSPGLLAIAGVHSLFDPDAAPPNGQNFYRWGARGSSVRDEHTNRFADIVDELGSTIDPDEVADLVSEAEGILADQVVMIPMWARPTAMAYWADELGAIEHNPTRGSITWNAAYWYRTDR